MISVTEALERIKNNTPVLPAQYLMVLDALGMTAATDVFSAIDFPPFNQSAMDGYGVHLDPEISTYQLVGEVKAGDDATGIDVKMGEAVRIFTGAMVPESVNAVVRQEDVIREKKSIAVDKEIHAGDNIREAGEQIKKNEAIIRKGQLLNAGTVGFLSMLGVDGVQVIRKPKIAMITTGNELLGPEEDLAPGKIYDSNTNMLLAALRTYGFEATVYSVKDDFDRTKETVAMALHENDVLLVTGGISVGDYDFVGDVMNDLNVVEQFYKVKQKPGKPLFFGTKDQKLVFGLPGNPAAAMSCFYVYVLQALGRMTGRKEHPLKLSRAVLSEGYTKTAAMTHFLKGYAENETVEILRAQSSAMLSDFVLANCLIVMEENRTDWQKGDEVDIFMF